MNLFGLFHRKHQETKGLIQMSAQPQTSGTHPLTPATTAPATDAVTKTVQSITNLTNTSATIVAAGVTTGIQSKIAGKTKPQAIADGISAAAQIAMAVPNPEVDAFAELANLIAGLIHLIP